MHEDSGTLCRPEKDSQNLQHFEFEIGRNSSIIYSHISPSKQDYNSDSWLCDCKEDKPSVSLALPHCKSYISTNLPQVLLVKPFPPAPRVAIKNLECPELHMELSGTVTSVIGMAEELMPKEKSP